MDTISQTTFSKYIFWNENVWILINISLKFVPKGPINNMPALVQIMAWCRPYMHIRIYASLSHNELNHDVIYKIWQIKYDISNYSILI